VPEDLKAAVLGAQNLGAPAGNPLGASNYGEISGLNKSSFQLPLATGAVSAGGQIAADQVAAAKAAAAHAEALAKKKAEDASDPSKYRQVQKDDGGYDYFDPDGNQVDIATLSKRTNTKPKDWLKDSQNPIDIQYLEDNNNMNDYIKAKLSGDKKKIQKYEDARPELKKYQGKGGAHQLITDFQNHYQRYYVPRSQDPNAWGARPADWPVVPVGGDNFDDSGL
jgi:hypothetical protein